MSTPSKEAIEAATFAYQRCSDFAKAEHLRLGKRNYSGAIEALMNCHSQFSDWASENDSKHQSQPPIDNKYVESGCEQFAAAQPQPRKATRGDSDPWFGVNIRDAIAAFAPANENIMERTPMDALNCLFYRIKHGHWKSDGSPSTCTRCNEATQRVRHHYDAPDGFPCSCGKPIDDPIHIPRIKP